MHVLHYAANELLVRVRLFFQKLLQQYEKYVWEKRNVAYSLSIRVQTTINHISNMTFLCWFFFTIWTSKKIFFQSASWKRHCATHWREQRGWDLVTFYWFVLSMRMQVILDSSFARPGSAPTRGGKKGEFRDWTKFTYDQFSSHLPDSWGTFHYAKRTGQRSVGIPEEIGTKFSD